MILKNNNFPKYNFLRISSVLLLALLGVLIGTNYDTFATSHTLNLTSSGVQDILVSSNGDGTAISADNITVSTTCRAGYNLTLSTTVNDNNLYLNGSASNNATGTFFSPSDGVAALNTTENTWGYFIASDGTIPTSSNVFHAVPTLDNPVTLKTPASTASESDINDAFSVYYGVSVSSNMTPGAYKMIKDGSDTDGALIYYATLAEDCFMYTVEFNPTGTNLGTAITGTGTVSSQSIVEGIATNLTTSTYSDPTVGGTTYYFAGWNTAQDGSGTHYASGQSVTDLTTAGNTITLYAQWTECPGEKICYKANGDDVVGTMGQQPVENTDTSIILLASNFSREGYGFAGWSDDEDAINHKDTAKIYGPQENISFTAGAYQYFGRMLYAVWVPSAGYLQDQTKLAELCGSGANSLTQAPVDGTANLNSVSALTDQRDGDTYAIAKLSDGNCWMIENMRLENTNSDNATGALAQGYGTSTTYGDFSGLADPESVWTDNTSAANSLYSVNGSNNTINIGTNNARYRFPRYNNVNTPAAASVRPINPTTNSDTNSTTNAGMYSYGNYYTWSAAVADTTQYSTNNQSIANTSICPSGWRLPKGGNKSNEANNEFWSLIVNSINGGTNPANYNSQTYPSYTGTAEAGPVVDAIRAYPNNIVFSGSIFEGSVNNRGIAGSAWTSTSNSGTHAYDLDFGSSTIAPGTLYTPKNNGRIIRCITSGS